jgi:hypothetical protein
MLTVMYRLTRSAFSVDFEWRRLIQLVLIMGGVAAAGDALLPTHGWVGFITRVGAFLLIPSLLFLTGFAHRQELDAARRIAARAARAARPGSAAA